MIQKYFKKYGVFSFLIAALFIFVFTVIVAASADAANVLADTSRPTITQVSPGNNELKVGTHDVVAVRFSEPIDPSTINQNTFTLMQRTTPESGAPLSAYRSTQLEGIITYNGVTATFTPKNRNRESGLPYYNPLQPDQEFGNVFTVTLTSGIQDLAGNSLSRNYVWSFTTGSSPFNAGATTAQLDQSPAPLSGAAIPVLTLPSTQPSSSSIPVATARPFSKFWIMSGLIALALIVLVYIIATRSTRSSRQKNVHTIEATHENPFGVVHPVIDIEGIGPEYNKGLSAMGIKNTKQLWEADAATISREIGAPLSSVKSWQHMAELATVKDIGPQYAELLERSGVHSINELKNYTPNALLKLVREKQYSIKARIQGNYPGYATANHWIQEARHHKSHVS